MSPPNNPVKFATLVFRVFPFSNTLCLRFEVSGWGPALFGRVQLQWFQSESYSDERGEQREERGKKTQRRMQWLRGDGGTTLRWCGELWENEGMIRERREGGGTEPAMRIWARNYFVIFLMCQAPCSDVSSIFVYICSVEYVAPNFFFGWRPLNVEWVGEEERTGAQ